LNVLLGQSVEFAAAFEYGFCMLADPFDDHITTTEARGDEDDLGQSECENQARDPRASPTRHPVLKGFRRDRQPSEEQRIRAYQKEYDGERIDRE
jgi:hypothetical protein